MAESLRKTETAPTTGCCRRDPSARRRPRSRFVAPSGERCGPPQLRRSWHSKGTFQSQIGQIPLAKIAMAVRDRRAGDSGDTRNVLSSVRYRWGTRMRKIEQFKKMADDYDQMAVSVQDPALRTMFLE